MQFMQNGVPQAFGVRVYRMRRYAEVISNGKFGAVIKHTFDNLEFAA